MTKKTELSGEAAQALAALHKFLKPGDTVYSILRHVSASGMSRRISFFVIVDGEPRYLDHSVSKITGYKRAPYPHDGLIVRGCGMDMGFSVVYAIGAKMWPNGTAKPHGARNGEPDSDGGYALKSRWI